MSVKILPDEERLISFIEKLNKIEKKTFEDEYLIKEATKQLNKLGKMKGVINDFNIMIAMIEERNVKGILSFNEEKKPIKKESKTIKKDVMDGQTGIVWLPNDKRKIIKKNNN